MSLGPTVGPPQVCPRGDGGYLYLHSERTHQASGCLLAIIGCCGVVVLIGLPVMIYGIYLFVQERREMICSTCGTRWPA
jgi:hypothetical protein